jgi:hypothetical protein
MARTISRSVGRGGVNLPNDVTTVQELLNDNIDKIKPLSPLVPDGRIGPATQAAIDQFQKVVVRMAQPDGRVDPGGRTLALLNQATKPSIIAPIVATPFRVVFQHFSTTPEPTSSKGTDALYESTVTVSGGKTGTFRGSIYPDDMSVKGRIKDGTYDIYIGFHKREGHTPKAGDLVARSQGFRAALIVNADGVVPVESNNPTKKTSQLIHVHNGFNSKRFSDGCPTIHPSDWNKFIQIFLDTYPNLSDWTETSTYIGKKVGTLEVKA